MPRLTLGDKLAMGRLDLALADHRPPQLVVDSSVRGVNTYHNTVLPISPFWDYFQCVSLDQIGKLRFHCASYQHSYFLVPNCI